jgi:hypothetical protein
MKLKIFSYNNFKLTLNIPELLLIEEFKKIIDNDKSKDKGQAFKYFTYIYLTQDPESPYVNFTRVEAEAQALSDISLKEVPDYVKIAAEKYHSIKYSTPVLRMIKKMEKGMKSLEDYFDTVNFIEKVDSGARKGTLLHDPKELIAIMKQAEFVIDSIKRLEKRALEELKQETATKGDLDLGWEEKLIIGDE